MVYVYVYKINRTVHGSEKTWILGSRLLRSLVRYRLTTRGKLMNELDLKVGLKWMSSPYVNKQFVYILKLYSNTILGSLLFLVEMD